MKLKTTDVKQSGDALQASLAEDIPTPFVITKNGKAVAALIPVTDDDIASLALSFDPRFIEIIEQSRADLAENGGLSLQEMKALFADDPSEAELRERVRRLPKAPKARSRSSR